MPLSLSPIYNLKAVLNETGIAADTLRAWERRYGVPMPQRTPGGHRLYSQRDIHLIKWLQARQAEGLSISRAVERWNELKASGDDPLAEAASAFQNGPSGLNASLDALREQWLEEALSFEDAASEQVLNQAFALHSVETVVTEVIQRGLREIGERWQHGEISVQQEHFVGALATRRFDTLIAATPGPLHPEAIVLACPPVELHSLPLLCLELLLRRHGRNVIFLGADVPMERLEVAAQAVKAVLVVMSAQRLTTALELRNTSAYLAKKHILVGYGGGVFNQLPELRAHIAGEFVGEDLVASRDRIEEILAKPVVVKVRRTPRSSVSAEAYRAGRSEIEHVLQQSLNGQNIPGPDLLIANSYFGAALGAALDFGSVAYLAADMSWLSLLLTRPRLPFQRVQEYATAYAAAMRQVMGNAANEISAWLEGYAPESQGISEAARKDQ